jgi:hypothetical protein
MREMAICNIKDSPANTIVLNTVYLDLVFAVPRNLALVLSVLCIAEEDAGYYFALRASGRAPTVLCITAVS